MLLFWFVLAAPGCGPSAREVMERAFGQDAPVMVEYQLDGSRLYKTRNIVLFADYARHQLRSLVMLVALSGEPAATDSVGRIGGLIKFRSVDSAPHFEVHRNLTLTVASQQHDLGPCAYVQDVAKEGSMIEDLTVVVPQELVKAIAAVDNIQGLIGEVPFELAGEQLAPIRTLVDTTRGQ